MSEIQMTREELFGEIRRMLGELFEADVDAVTEESRLIEDLDLDSIDAVDMIVALQKKTGRRIKPEEFKTVRTVGDVLDVLERLMQEPAGKEN